MKRKTIAMFLSLAMIATSFSMPVMAEEVVEDAVLIEAVQDEAESIEKIEKIENDENITEEKIEKISETEVETLEEITSVEAENTEEVIDEITDVTKTGNNRNDKEYNYRYEWEEDGEHYWDQYWVNPCIRIGTKDYLYCDRHYKYLINDSDILEEDNKDICELYTEITLADIKSNTGLDVAYIPRATDIDVASTEKGTWQVEFNNNAITGVIATDENLDIELTGTNSIANRKDVDYTTLDVYGNLTIGGTGSLAVSVGNKCDEGAKWHVCDCAIYVDKDFTIEDTVTVSAVVRADYPITETYFIDKYNGQTKDDPKWFMMDWNKMTKGGFGFDMRQPVVCGDNATLKIEDGSTLKILKSPLNIDVNYSHLKPGNPEGYWTVFSKLNSVYADNIIVEGSLDAYALYCIDAEFNNPDSVKLTDINAMESYYNEATDSYYEVGSIKISNMTWNTANLAYYPNDGLGIYTKDMTVDNSTVGKISGYNDVWISNLLTLKGTTTINAAINTSKCILENGEALINAEGDAYDWAISKYDEDDEYYNRAILQIKAGEMTVKGGINPAFSFITPSGYKIVEGSGTLADDLKVVNRSHAKPFVHICDDPGCTELSQAMENKNNIVVKIAGETISGSEGIAAGNGWSFDKATKTLKLNGFVGENDDVDFTICNRWGDIVPAKAAIYASNDINIEVISNNKIMAKASKSGEDDFIGAIYSLGNINMTGNGRIDVKYEGSPSLISDVLYADEALGIDSVKISSRANEESEDEFSNGLYGADGVTIKNTNILLENIRSYDRINIENATLRGIDSIFTRDEEYGLAGGDSIHIKDSTIGAAHLATGDMTVTNSTLNGENIWADTFVSNNSNVSMEDNIDIDLYFKVNDSKVSMDHMYFEYDFNRRGSGEIYVNNSELIVASDYMEGVNDCVAVYFTSGKLDVSSQDSKAFDPTPKFDIAKGYGITINTPNHVVIDKVAEVINNEVSKTVELKDKKGNVYSANITTNVKDADGNDIPVAVDISDMMTIDTAKGVVTFAKAKDMPDVDGYTFKGWTTKDGGKNKKVTKIQAKKLKDMTVTATYVENVYNVMYKITKPAGAKVSGKATNLKKVKYTDKIKIDATAITATDKSGKTYKLIGWSTKPNEKTAEYTLGQETSKLGGQTKKDKKVVLYSVWE